MIGECEEATQLCQKSHRCMLETKHSSWHAYPARPEHHSAFEEGFQVLDELSSPTPRAELSFY